MNFYTMNFYHKYQQEIWMIIVAFMWLIPYFLINAFSDGRTELTLNTYLDSLFPVVPLMTLVYISSFIVVILPYFLIKDKEKFKHLAWCYLGVMLIAYLIFIILPIKALRPEINGGGLFYNILLMVYSLDFPYNNFPSLHVGLSFLSSLIIFCENKKAGSYLLVWAGLIALSTLLIKQHTILDVLGGLILSIGAYFVYFKLRNK